MFIMQTTSALLAIKLQTFLQTLKNSQFFYLDFEQVLYEEYKCSCQKLCRGAVALKIPRKLTCGSSFCNVVGCKTEILMELGYTNEIYLKCCNVSCNVCYNVSNWLVLFTYPGDVTKTSEIGLLNWRTSCDVMVISEHGTGHSN